MARRTNPDMVDSIVAQWGAARPDLDVSAIEVFGRLHRSFLRYQAHLSALFAEFGINMAAFDVLTALRRSGPPYRRSAGELADTALVTLAGLSLRIDRLETAGLVARERDEHDRRIVHCVLTERGMKLVDEVASAHFENESRMLAGLSTTERKQLAGLLAKLEISLADASISGQPHKDSAS